MRARRLNGMPNVVRRSLAPCLATPEQDSRFCFAERARTSGEEHRNLGKKLRCRVRQDTREERALEYGNWAWAGTPGAFGIIPRHPHPRSMSA